MADSYQSNELQSIIKAVSDYTQGYWYANSRQHTRTQQRNHPPTNSVPPTHDRPQQASDNNTALSFEQRKHALRELHQRIKACAKCPLHTQRIQAVPGIGVLDPQVMIIGEAPGANEDRYGQPFVGRAGKYLDAWLASIDLFRTKNVFIANIIKCRPPQNRDPKPDEIAQCRPYLDEQIRLVQPKALLITGRIAAQHIFQRQDSLAQLRITSYMWHNIPVFITYHPSAVLRNPKWRRPVWDDLQQLHTFLKSV